MEKALYMTPDGHDPQTHHPSQVPAIVVKTEPVDMDEGPESLSSPIVISSSENEDFTRRQNLSREMISLHLLLNKIILMQGKLLHCWSSLCLVERVRK